MHRVLAEHAENIKMHLPLRQITKHFGEAALGACFLFFFFCLEASGQSLHDLKNVPQNPQAYLSKSADMALISPERQLENVTRYLKFYYAPWADDGIKHLKISPELILNIQKKTLDRGGWTRQDVPVSRQTILHIQKQMSVPFGALNVKGISLAQEDLRILPTKAPFYPEPTSSVARYFDRLQNSTVKVGEPLRLLHLSLDNRWVFVSNASAVGWLPRQSVSPVTDSFIETYTRLPLHVMIQDNVALTPQSALRSKLGTLLPMEKGKIQVPRSGSDGYATLKASSASEKSFAPFPLPLTERNATRILSAIGTERYGWGGSYGLRDCSATTQDYATPFGLWLPRNSKDQAAMGQTISVSKMSPAQKKAALRQQGIPFLTLVHLPGHIMLYVGKHQGEPVVFHNLWGIHIMKNNKPDRYVVGRTLFSSLRPGSEFKNRRPNSFLENRMDSFNIIIN